MSAGNVVTRPANAPRSVTDRHKDDLRARVVCATTRAVSESRSTGKRRAACCLHELVGGQAATVKCTENFGRNR
jgi:hypothetical protein